MRKILFILIIAITSAISCQNWDFAPLLIVKGDPVYVQTKSINYNKGKEEFVINDIWKDSVFINNILVDTAFYIDVSSNVTTFVITVNQDSATIKTYDRW